MRAALGFLTLVTGIGAAAFAGCSSPSASAVGSAGTASSSTGQTSSSSSSSSSASSSSASSSAGGNCAGLLAAGPCNDCITSSCCAAASACEADASCKPCLPGGSSDPATCQANLVYGALQSCVSESCLVECKPKSSCNPVTNEGCKSAEDACDYAPSTGVFFCAPPPNTTPICGACPSGGSGPFCAGGGTCAYAGGKSCARFCCDDGDCAGGTCDLAALAGKGLTVGLCLGGGDAGAKDPTCAAPAVAPSGGKCFTF